MALTVGAETVVEIVRNDLDFVVDGSPRPIGPLQ